jgi:GntR family transcriptional regulator
MAEPAQIDLSSPLPMYMQLQRIFRDKILSGCWEPGSQIPVQQELAQQYAVSLAVVRQAIQTLVNEGLLVKRQGKGTFVLDLRIKQGPRELTSFTQELHAKGVKAGSVVLEKGWIECDDALAKIFAISPKSKVVWLRRLRTADQKPLGIQTFYAPEYLVPQLLSYDFSGSLYVFLEQTYHIRIVRAIEKYFATMLDEDDCVTLEVQYPFAGFYVERIAYDHTGQVVEYTKSWMRSDNYCVEIQLER